MWVWLQVSFLVSVRKSSALLSENFLGVSEFTEWVRVSWESTEELSQWTTKILDPWVSEWCQWAIVFWVSEWEPCDFFERSECASSWVSGWERVSGPNFLWLGVCESGVSCAIVSECKWVSVDFFVSQASEFGVSESWVSLRKGSSRKGIEKQIQLTTKILDPWNPNTLFRGVQNIHYYFDVRRLQGYPLCAIVFCIFWKGLVRKSTIWALLIFLHSRTFQARFGVWSLLLPAQRVLRASERVWERVQLGKELRNKFN